jgi:sulfatase maturation enzyme AslB (radical SAM superfamily)
MKTLGIISASKCNLKCEYCYLHKNKSYINEDEKTLQAILDGSFIKNVKRTLKKLSIDREDFGRLELWGGETTLHFSSSTINFFKEIFDYFTNIHIFSFSSNFTINSDNYVELIKELDKNLDRKIQMHIQISMDGPDWILSQTRHIEYSKIKNNLINFINKFNSIQLKNIEILITYKATWTWEIYKEVNKNIDSIKQYLTFCKQEENDINNIIFNKQVHFSVGGMYGPMLEIPHKYTQQDGIDMAKFLLTHYSYKRELEELNLTLENETIYMPILTLGLDKTLDKDVYYLYKNQCRQMVDELLFKWDGSLSACSNGFLDNNEENLEYLKENDLEEYKNVLKSKDWLPKYKEGEVDLDEILKKYRYMSTFWEDYNEFNLTVLVSQILELADCGLISPNYKNNYNKALRHALMMINGPIVCYFHNLRKTGSPYVTDFDLIKLYCNGFLDLFEEIYSYGN